MHMKNDNNGSSPFAYSTNDLYKDGEFTETTMENAVNPIANMTGTVSFR